MSDAYHETYHGEIHRNSRCIWHENTLQDFLRSNLIALGYESQDSSKRHWCRDGKSVITCLVDDFTSCSTDYSMPVTTLFDEHTTVITDNWVSCPTRYRVIRLPDSFAGIYAYQPHDRVWQPRRRFCFSVRRIDTRRVLLLLELVSRSQMRGIDLDSDYVNFDCWSWDGDNDSDIGRRENFSKIAHSLEEQYTHAYQHVIERLHPQMPIRNYHVSHEDIHVGAWLNIVVETYGSDTVVALSEKIFRALVTPAPWMVYGGKYTVSRLQSMGFDVLDDVLDHGYDSKQDLKTAKYGDKAVDFVFEASDAVSRLQDQNFKQLQIRCRAAADHNRDLLDRFQGAWPGDFAQWWASVLPLIS